MSTSTGTGGRAAVPSSLSVLAVALVLLAAAVVALAHPTEGRPRRAAASPAGQLVTHTRLGCPDLSLGAAARTSVSLGLAPGAGLRDGGQVRTGSTVPLARGHLVSVPSAGGPGLAASGAAAAGVFGFRVDRASSRSLAVGWCVQPGARWWFTGAGAGLDHSSTLLLRNLDAGPAVVDLRVLGPDGDVATVATHGIVVAAHSQRRLALAGIAPQTDDLALEVHTERGRVAAAVSDSFRARATAPWGHEWLVGTERRSRTLWLAGLPSTPGRRTVLVANPSPVQAVVDLAVSGRSGTFAPTGLSAVSVAPGAVASVDVSRSAPRGEPVALRLRSQVPILAAVRSTQSGDHSVAPAVTRLTGPAAAPLVRGSRATVQLTAGTAGARVQVEAYDGRGRRVAGTTRSIGSGATVAWSPGHPAAYLVVRPLTGRGTVRGAVSYAGGGLSVVPLVDLPLRELRPQVAPGLR